jgi:hypothetical protein
MRYEKLVVRACRVNNSTPSIPEEDTITNILVHLVGTVRDLYHNAIPNIYSELRKLPLQNPMTSSCLPVGNLINYRIRSGSYMYCLYQQIRDKRN